MALGVAYADSRIGRWIQVAERPHLCDSLRDHLSIEIYSHLASAVLQCRGHVNKATRRDGCCQLSNLAGAILNVEDNGALGTYGDEIRVETWPVISSKENHAPSADI